MEEKSMTNNFVDTICIIYQRNGKNLRKIEQLEWTLRAAGIAVVVLQYPFMQEDPKAIEDMETYDLLLIPKIFKCASLPNGENTCYYEENIIEVILEKITNAADAEQILGIKEVLDKYSLADKINDYYLALYKKVMYKSTFEKLKNAIMSAIEELKYKANQYKNPDNRYYFAMFFLLERWFKLAYEVDVSQGYDYEGKMSAINEINQLTCIKESVRYYLNAKMCEYDLLSSPLCKTYYEYAISTEKHRLVKADLYHTLSKWLKVDIQPSECEKVDVIALKLNLNSYLNYEYYWKYYLDREEIAFFIDGWYGLINYINTIFEEGIILEDFTYLLLEYFYKAYALLLDCLKQEKNEEFVVNACYTLIKNKEAIEKEILRREKEMEEGIFRSFRIRVLGARLEDIGLK